ncbi:hypothetical protein A9978_18745 [Pseudomonas sp. UMC65]|uniref:hypothetical protein n=1 Tax=Pseudomonas sp. UMC65 TaxID=1862323 RepID=UPI00160372A3|nr:hypothetical protein [Pseudomonas sp. UMC65]MBB1614480.1 hypothetical protein [Pseudomonas sp. UMC65]
MSDKMKSQFETWYLDSVVEMYGEGVRVLAKSNLLWLRDDGSYADATLRFALMAWQASREAVVVDLSLAQEESSKGCGSNDMGDFVFRAAKEAIESLGMRVKP